jgi:hypothetical protein
MVPFTKQERNVEIYSKELKSSSVLAEKESCWNQPFCWWSPPSDLVAVQFCQETNLHGLKYLGKLQMRENVQNENYIAPLHSQTLLHYSMNHKAIRNYRIANDVNCKGGKY